MIPKVLRCALLLSVASAVWLRANDAPTAVSLGEDVLPQLRPILEKAMSQAPRLIDSNLAVVAADAYSYMLSARRYPSAGADFSYRAEKENRYTGDGWVPTSQLTYNASINQPVWQWGILEAAVKNGRIGQEIARRNYAEAYRLLALEVRSGYLQAILSKMTARNAAYSEKLARENLKRQEALFEAQKITMGEILNFRLMADEASLATRRAASDFQFVLRNFRRVTGIVDFAATDVPDSIPEVQRGPDEVAPAPDAVLFETDVFRISELNLQMAKLDYRSARFNRFPRFSLETGISQNQVSYTVDVGQRYQVADAFLGVRVYWNIFDGPNTKGLKLAAMTRIRQAERARETLKETLRQAADTEAASVTFAWQTYRNSAMRYRFAREALAKLRENLARGQASQEQVEAGQLAQYQAESSAQFYLVGYLNAAAQYSSTLRADPFARVPVHP